MKKALIFLPLLLLMMVSAIPPQKTSEKASTSNVINYREAKQALEEAKGEKLNLKEKIALKVATKQANKHGFGGSGNKSQLVALLLCLFVGVLGIHRFYLGYTTEGIIQLFTFGLLGIWTLIDLIRIITGDLKPKKGEYDEKL